MEIFSHRSREIEIAFIGDELDSKVFDFPTELPNQPLENVPLILTACSIDNLEPT